MEPLSTRGRDIIGANSGLRVRLRGVNLSGLEYDPDHPGITRDSVREIADWGANIIRLPFNQEWALRLPGYLDRLDQVIEWAAEAGLYTLLDLQWISDGLPYGGTNHVPPLPIPESAEMWTVLARRYRSRPAVLYDVFNEPHDPLPDDPYPLLSPAGEVLEGGYVDHARWRAWAETLVDAIRAEHPESLVFVSGIEWGYDLRGFPLDRANIVYSTHVYQPRGEAWPECFGALASGHPVFAAEWGFSDGLEWGQRLVSYLDELGLGWTAWSWNDKPFLRDGSGLTPFGQLVRDSLARD